MNDKDKMRKKIFTDEKKDFSGVKWAGGRSEAIKRFRLLKNRKKPKNLCGQVLGFLSMGEILIKIYLGPYSLNVACSGPHESQLYKQCCE